MGYRSSVATVVYPDTAKFEGERGVMNKWQEEKFNVLKLLMGTKYATIMEQYFGGTWEDEMFALTFQINDVKWYSGYGDVEAFETMLEELVELGYSYEFMRIGEEHNDVEHRTGGDNIDYVIGVQREFTWDW